MNCDDADVDADGRRYVFVRTSLDRLEEGEGIKNVVIVFQILERFGYDIHPAALPTSI